jgi:hypothetical protein
MKSLVIAFMIMCSVVMASADQADSTAAPAEAMPHIIARMDISYIPVGTIKYDNTNEKINIYDNVFYRLSAEYFITDLFSVGPSFEYQSRHLDPTGYSDYNVKSYGFFLDFRTNYNFTDSSYNYMVIGLGSGAVNLGEKGNSSATGFAIYGIIGLDLAVSGPVGCDLIYRYQFAQIGAPFREYRYNGSVVQTGLNYRFRF